MELHGLYQTKREAVEGGKKGAHPKAADNTQLFVSSISLWQRLVLKQPWWEARPPSFCIYKQRLQGSRMHKMNCKAWIFILWSKGTGLVGGSV